MKSKSSFGVFFPPFRLRDALVVEGVHLVNQGVEVGDERGGGVRRMRHVEM